MLDTQARRADLIRGEITNQSIEIRELTKLNDFPFKSIKDYKQMHDKK
jgi:hypothetical protein